MICFTSFARFASTFATIIATFASRNRRSWCVCEKGVDRHLSSQVFVVLFCLSLSLSLSLPQVSVAAQEADQTWHGNRQPESERLVGQTNTLAHLHFRRSKPISKSRPPNRRLCLSCRRRRRCCCSTLYGDDANMQASAIDIE
jgi:hypothetical protein